MSIYEREKEYVNLLSAGDYTVKELAQKLYISEPTVRRDIILMKEKELVTCNRGRVRLKRNVADKRIPLLIRDCEQMEEKQIIAAKAASYIQDGDVIMLDASTSAQCLIPHLARRKDIFVITNGARTALQLAAFGIKTICTGGELTTESFSYIGPDAERTLEGYHADIAFFSCRGLNAEGIASDNSIMENSIRRIMIARAKASYLLCDSSKLGATYLNTLCDTSGISGVICDIPLHERGCKRTPLSTWR